ncbi:hypothetical protein MT418_001943 [Batrachochytrium dendrobatidis]
MQPSLQSPARPEKLPALGLNSLIGTEIDMDCTDYYAQQKQQPHHQPQQLGSYQNGILSPADAFSEVTTSTVQQTPCPPSDEPDHVQENKSDVCAYTSLSSTQAQDTIMNYSQASGSAAKESGHLIMNSTDSGFKGNTNVDEPIHSSCNHSSKIHVTADAVAVKGEPQVIELGHDQGCPTLEAHDSDAVIMKTVLIRPTQDNMTWLNDTHCINSKFNTDTNKRNQTGLDGSVFVRHAANTTDILETSTAAVASTPTDFQNNIGAPDDHRISIAVSPTQIPHSHIEAMPAIDSRKNRIFTQHSNDSQASAEFDLERSWTNPDNIHRDSSISAGPEFESNKSILNLQRQHAPECQEALTSPDSAVPAIRHTCIQSILAQPASPQPKGDCGSGQVVVSFDKHDGDVTKEMEFRAPLNMAVQYQITQQQASRKHCSNEQMQSVLEDQMADATQHQAKRQRNKTVSQTKEISCSLSMPHPHTSYQQSGHVTILVTPPGDRGSLNSLAQNNTSYQTVSSTTTTPMSSVSALLTTVDAMHFSAMKLPLMESRNLFLAGSSPISADDTEFKAKPDSFSSTTTSDASVGTLDILPKTLHPSSTATSPTIVATAKLSVVSELPQFGKSDTLLTDSLISDPATTAVLVDIAPKAHIPNHIHTYNHHNSISASRISSQLSPTSPILSSNIASSNHTSQFPHPVHSTASSATLDPYPTHRRGSHHSNTTSTTSSLISSTEPKPMSTETFETPVSVITTHIRQPRWSRQSSACDYCHSKKIRCHGPIGSCPNCVKRGLRCVFNRQSKPKKPTEYIAQLQQRIESLEHVVVTKGKNPAKSRSGLLNHASIAAPVGEIVTTMSVPFGSQRFDTPTVTVQPPTADLSLGADNHMTDVRPVFLPSPRSNSNIQHSPYTHPVPYPLQPPTSIRIDLIERWFRYCSLRQNVLIFPSWLLTDLSAQPPFLLNAIYAQAALASSPKESNAALISGHRGMIHSSKGEAFYEHAKSFVSEALSSPSYHNILALHLLGNLATFRGRPEGPFYTSAAIRLIQLYLRDCEPDDGQSYPRSCKQELVRRLWWSLYETDRRTSLANNLPLYPVDVVNGDVPGFPQDLLADFVKNNDRPVRPTVDRTATSSAYLHNEQATRSHGPSFLPPPSMSPHVYSHPSQSQPTAPPQLPPMYMEARNHSPQFKRTASSPYTQDLGYHHADQHMASNRPVSSTSDHPPYHRSPYLPNQPERERRYSHSSSTVDPTVPYLHRESYPYSSHPSNTTSPSHPSYSGSMPPHLVEKGHSDPHPYSNTQGYPHHSYAPQLQSHPQCTPPPPSQVSIPSVTAQRLLLVKIYDRVVYFLQSKDPAQDSIARDEHRWAIDQDLLRWFENLPVAWRVIPSTYGYQISDAILDTFFKTAWLSSNNDRRSMQTMSPGAVQSNALPSTSVSGSTSAAPANDDVYTSHHSSKLLRENLISLHGANAETSIGGGIQEFDDLNRLTWGVAFILVWFNFSRILLHKDTLRPLEPQYADVSQPLSAHSDKPGSSRHSHIPIANHICIDSAFSLLEIVRRYMQTNPFFYETPPIIFRLISEACCVIVVGMEMRLIDLSKGVPVVKMGMDALYNLSVDVAGADDQRRLIGTLLDRVVEKLGVGYIRNS